ncbi:hypothetical protein Hanom_Chr05g00400521 [Helianthus anomalus]
MAVVCYFFDKFCRCSSVQVNSVKCESTQLGASQHSGCGSTTG